MITWVSHTELIDQSGVSRNTFNKRFLPWILKHFPPQKVVKDRKSWTQDRANQIMDAIKNGEVDTECSAA